ncbi:MAG: transposase [Nitrosospira sp.]|nr:transposase [Nitrosospira sp.]
MQETLPSLSQKCPWLKGICYALKLWVALVRYTSYGRIEIDNNAAERSLRSACSCAAHGR